MLLPWIKCIRTAAVALIVPAGWAGQPAPPPPGTLNYLAGNAAIDQQPVSPALMQSIEPGQTFLTTNGRAEVLLAPGVLLRVGQRSSIRILARDLKDTQIEVVNGEIMIEATRLLTENRIRILTHGAAIDLLKRGLYRFDADREAVAVLEGKVQVLTSNTELEVKSGREVSLNVPLAMEKFDRKRSQESDLYKWSKWRSQYLSNSSSRLARELYRKNKLDWYGSGWYWNSDGSGWSFLPRTIINSPFGWRYYSPDSFVDSQYVLGLGHSRGGHSGFGGDHFGELYAGRHFGGHH